jgi:hypothetical protein
MVGGIWVMEEEETCSSRVVEEMVMVVVETCSSMEGVIFL